MDTLTLFSKNLNQRSLTPRWPLTPCLLRSHVWLYPRIIVSKSHDNTSMHVDTVINFAKYHIHTHTYTYYIHTHTYYVQNEWSHSLLLNSVQARQKWKRVFLACHCHEIDRDEAVGLKSCKYTWKITIYVNMCNLGQFRESLIFCR